MDNKYGRLFNEDDVNQIISMLQGHSLQRVDTLLDEFEGTFPKDEPQFVIRGQDAAARVTIDDYIINSKIVGASVRHMASAKDARELLKTWQSQNPDKVKVPD